MKSQGYSRRRVLLTGASGILGATAVSSTAATQEQPDPDESDDLLAEMDGLGSAADPYIITDVRELHAMRADREASYVLGNDIDATPTTAWNDGAGFKSIGTFSGDLDGDGNTIRGLSMHRPERALQTTIEVLYGTVRDLRMVEVDITGGKETAALAWILAGGHVENVLVSGEVEGTDQVAGMISRAAASGDGEDGGVLRACVSRCTVRGEETVGGLVGRADYADAGLTIERCSAGGTVEGRGRVGGLIGSAEQLGREASVDDCIATVELRCNGGETCGGLIGALDGGAVRRSRAAATIDSGTASSVGGLIGSTRSGYPEILDCSAHGSIRGRMNVGGLVGRLYKGTVRRCYATADVRGRQRVGGLVGGASWASIQDAYATGAVHGAEGAVAGLVGRYSLTRGAGTIERVYATGAVTAEDSDQVTGGVVGTESDAVIHDAYWDATATGQSSSAGVPDHHGVPTERLQGSTAESTLEGFDFDVVWRSRPAAYPALRTVQPEYAIESVEVSGPAVAGRAVSVTVEFANVGDQPGHDPVRLLVADDFADARYPGVIHPGEQRTVTFSAVEMPETSGSVHVSARVGYAHTSQSVPVRSPGSDGPESDDRTPASPTENSSDAGNASSGREDTSPLPGFGIAGSLAALAAGSRLLNRGLSHHEE